MYYTNIKEESNLPSVFRIQGTDKRKEFEEAFDNGEPFISQKIGGKNVKFFSPKTGFVLLRNQTKIKMNSVTARRIRSIIEISREPRSVIRDQYYDLSGRPTLVKPFEGTEDLYNVFLDSINKFEILCDLSRDVFTSGLSKGIVFYGHNHSYGNSERMIAFTEFLAEKGLNELDIANAQNIIVDEKMASVQPMVGTEQEGGGKGKFSRLTNSVIVTCGGQFNRAVQKLINRFKDSKKILLFADGDVYGRYMNLTVSIGSKASRHLDNKVQHANVHDVGLFPSVCKELGLPNDREEKRPMESKTSRDRINLLEYCGYDKRDLKVFRENLTYEIQAINAKYKDSNRRKIGQEIYLTEVMRILNLPCKPEPPEDDERLLRIFKNTALYKFKQQIEEQVISEDMLLDISAFVDEKIKEFTEDLVNKIYDEYEQELTNLAENVSAEKLREKIKEQYQNDPYRERYSLTQIAEEMMPEVDVSVPWDSETFQNLLGDKLDTYFLGLEEQNETYEETIKLQELPDAEEIRPFYDVVEEEIGANPEDAKEIREALKKRLVEEEE